MKTLEQILSRKSDCLDGRDVSRLTNFLPVSEWGRLGLKVKEGADVSGHVPEELNEENVMKHLAHDLDFGFEKALNQRGLSAGMMYAVVKMWMWVLDDPLGESSDSDYAQYGLPFFKAVAVKYSLPNPIGDDAGTERKYASC